MNCVEDGALLNAMIVDLYINIASAVQAFILSVEGVDEVKISCIPETCCRLCTRREHLRDLNIRNSSHAPCVFQEVGKLRRLKLVCWL